MKEELPLLLRPKEAAQLLGIGTQTVYQLARAGEIPVLHIGKSVRIPRKALVAWLESMPTVPSRTER